MERSSEAVDVFATGEDLFPTGKDLFRPLPRDGKTFFSSRLAETREKRGDVVSVVSPHIPKSMFQFVVFVNKQEQHLYQEPGPWPPGKHVSEA